MRKQAVLSQIAFLVAFLAVWEAATRLGRIDPIVLPPFSDVAAMLWRLLDDREFVRGAGDTLVRVGAAYAIGAPLALSLGFLLGERLHLGGIVNPIIHFVLAVPQSVFLPLFILIFGIGFLEKVVFGITHILFVVIVNTVAAVGSVPKGLVLAGRSFGATPGQIYARIYLPAMMPLIVTGLRLGMVFNVIGILLAEMYGSRTGIGHLIFRWGESYEIKEMMAAILAVSIATIVFNEMMRLWEARVGRWQAAAFAS